MQVKVMDKTNGGNHKRRIRMCRSYPVMPGNVTAVEVQNSDSRRNQHDVHFDQGGTIIRICP